MRSSPTHCGPQFAMSSSPLSVASSVPSSLSFLECGWGDVPELLLFGDQPPSPPCDFDAEKCLSELASPKPPLLTPPPSPPSSSRAPTTSQKPVSPPCRPHVTPTPYQVALEAMEEALMCTAVPPPSPPQPPKYVPKDPPTPPKTHCSRALQCQNTAAHPGESRGWGSVFRRRGAEPPSDVPDCSSAAQEKPPGGWQEGMRISRSHFFSRDEEHSAVVLEILCSTPKPPSYPQASPHNLCLVGRCPLHQVIR